MSAYTARQSGDMPRHSQPRIRLAAAIALLAATPALRSGTIYWNNTAGGEFGTGSNWVGGVAPGLNDAAIFGWNPSFRAAQPIDISFTTGYTIQSLNIQDAVHNFPNAALILSGGLNVGDLIQSNGNPGTATLNFTGTIKSSTGVISVGKVAGTTGILNFNGAYEAGAGALLIGIAGAGTMNLPGSAMVVSNSTGGGFDIGINRGATGSVTVGPSAQMAVQFDGAGWRIELRGPGYV